MIAITSGDSSPEGLPFIPSGSHEFKKYREVETVVARWLITLNTD